MRFDVGEVVRCWSPSPQRFVSAWINRMVSGDTGFSFGVLAQPDSSAAETTAETMWRAMETFLPDSLGAGQLQVAHYEIMIMQRSFVAINCTWFL